MRVAARLLQQRCSSRPTTVCPNWWQQGWSRQRAGSVAEAELLAPLGELLMPNTPILELFRSFPSPPGWAGNYLEPDLAAHGVLKDREAALFIEYDGYWRHGEKAGMEMDQLKNAALLAYAPAGSKVIRISHIPCKPVTLESNKGILEICVDVWRQGDSKRCSGALDHVFAKMVDSLEEALDPKTLKQLQMQSLTGTIHISNAARAVAEAAAIARGGNSVKEISRFLNSEGYSRKNVSLMLKGSISGWRCIETNLRPKLKWLRQLGLSHDQVTKVVSTSPAILGYSIEQNLKTKAQWLLDLGLKRTQVAKAVANSPSILGLSIERNLKPTVQWLWDLGLNKAEIAKAVATYPAILGLSIDQNLELTVQWLLDLGWNKTHVAKAVATSPAILGLSIQNNLNTKAQWLLDLGLKRTQVAKAVATSPSILGLSIERNLKPTVQWLLDLGLNKAEIARAVATFPGILGLSIEQNLKPTVQWLLDLGWNKTHVAKAVSCKPQILGYSIEQNLKPTVQWLMDLGLTKTQVAKAVAMFPPTLGLSIEQNLKPTVQWLLDLGLNKERVAKAVACKPQLLGYSIEQNLKPTVQWMLDLGLTKTQVAKAVAAFPAILGCSIEWNLKLTVRWLLDKGLTESEVAVAVASFPNFLGLSIDKNLQPKYSLLLAAFGPTEAGQLIAKCPRILSYSHQRLTERLSVLAGCNKTEKLASAMALATPAFEKRFSRGPSRCFSSGALAAASYGVFGLT